MSLSSARSPRSPVILAASKRFSASASEIFKKMAALISCPEPEATDITWFSSPDQRPIEERMSGYSKRSFRSKYGKTHS